MPPDLLAHACIRARLPDGRLLRWLFENQGQSLQLDVPGPLTLDEASLARIAELDGVGIGFFLEPDVRDDIAAGRLVPLLGEWLPTLAPPSLYYPNRRNPSAAFKAFVDHAWAFGLARSAAAASRPVLHAPNQR